MMRELLATLLFPIRKLLGRARVEREIDDELEFHLASLTEQYMERGITARNARLAAARTLGGTAQVREAYRDQLTFPSLEAILQDTRYGLRALRKAPGFTLTAVAVLGLGIGLNAGLFSVVRTLCFRPLPLPGSDRLYYVTGYTGHASMRRKFSYPDFEAIREQGDRYIQLAGYDPYHPVQVGGTAGAPAELARAALVSDNFFAVLNASARYGATFDANATRTVVLSDGFRRRRFGAGTIPVGTSIQLNQQVFTVIGVMPPEFQGPDIVLPDIWIRLQDQPAIQAGHSILHDPATRGLILLGRLPADTSPMQTQAALSALVARLPDVRQDEDRQKSVRLNQAVPFPISDDMAPFFLLLSVPTGLVLLIACANLANLMLARAVLRGKEMATRLALGASRRRLVQQLLTESLLLALLGGLAGTVLAAQVLQVCARLLMGITSGMGLIRPVFALDAGVWGLMLGLSFLASLVCGLTPALYASRQDLSSGARQEGIFAGAAHGAWLRNALMVAQVAVCTVLLVAAGLMLRSFQKSLATDPGFATEGIVALQVNLGMAGYPPSKAGEFHKRVRARLEALPHVRSVAAASAPPLSDRPSAPVLLPASPGTSEEYRFLSPYNRVSPEYFKLFGIPVVGGRTFTQAEVSAHAPVALVSQSTAQHLWPGASPLGKRVHIQIDESSPVREVVGVVGDTRSVWLSRVDVDYIYLPFDGADQQEGAVIVQLDRDLPTSRSQLTDAMASIDAELPVRLQPMSQLLNQWRLLPLAASALALSLGLVALTLAGVGMYGVMSYLVSQRKREFGIRIALGARKPEILSMVFRQGFRVLAIGLVLGFVGATTLARFLMGSFYGLSPYDPAAFGFVVIFLGGTAMSAMFGPAIRAVRVDPAISLRGE